MPVSWFICPYKRRLGGTFPIRYCAMDDYTTQIEADGGRWAESEVLGNHAIVKVSASAATLTTIAGTSGFQRIPVNALETTLGSLTVAQGTATRNKIEEAWLSGY